MVKYIKLEIFSCIKKKGGVTLKRFKGIVLGLVCLIVIATLIVTWVYPFSLFSVHKSYTYIPDSSIVDSHVKSLNDFKKLYSKSNEDVTTKSTPAILQIYEQEWLVNKESVTMNEDKFDSILFKVKSARATLLRLTVQEKYTIEQRSYLLDCIKNMLSLEETILMIKNDKWEPRSTEQRRFHNLQSSFDSSFTLFVSFYELSQT